MTQVVNDQMIDELRASFFHKRREAWLLANNDVRPNDDRRGIGGRWINQIGLTTWTSHFRTGDVAGAGELATYSWINDGTFTGAPGNLAYSIGGEALRGRRAGAAERHFLAAPITNAAASYQNTYLYGRFAAGGSAGGTSTIGLRFDSGADGAANEFYVELYASGAGNGTYTVSLRSRVNAVGPVVVTTTINNSVARFETLALRSLWSGGVYTGQGYVVNEVGALVSLGVASAAYTAYVPQVGRAGVIISNAGDPDDGYCDWFYNTFP